jgi:hypothetical protein
MDITQSTTQSLLTPQPATVPGSSQTSQGAAPMPASIPGAPPSAGAGGPVLPSPGDPLFGKIDPARIKNYFMNHYAIFDRITSVLESNKSLLIYESQADPYVVFLKVTASSDFSVDDVILLIGMVMVFGRSLKSLNKQKTSESGKKFIALCTKYKIRPSYNRRLKGDPGTWTTKVEHCFAAYPLIAKFVMIYLYDQGFLNISTCFTSRGMDFQSSTALSTWKDIGQALANIFVHEIKSQMYIDARTFQTDPSALYKPMNYRGKQMTVQEARRQNIIDSRQYVLLGMLSPDIVVKVLWAMSINCPPFKAKPAPYRFAEKINTEMGKIAPTPVMADTTWTWDVTNKNAEDIAKRSTIKDAWEAEANATPKTFHSCGIMFTALSVKVALLTFIAKSLGTTGELKRALALFGLESGLGTSNKYDNLTANPETAFAALREHFSG